MGSRYSENCFKTNFTNHLNPENVCFSMFTTEEIKKLCVMKIITPLTLDPLGYPLPGGLYDKKLGPISEKGDPCATCSKNIYECPGHFGYIDLPLPVVNPLFHKTLGIILKLSCFHCFHLQIPTHIKRSLCIQVKLLNNGFVTEAIEIENKIMELISQFESFENIPEDKFEKLQSYEDLINEAQYADTRPVLNKNTETLRNQFINNMLVGVKTKASCIFCKQPKSTVQLLKNKIILVQKKGKDFGTPAGTTLKQKVHVSESKYITPEESRSYMRKIWENEKELLQNLVSVFNSINSEHPTDVCFVDVIPVPPPNVRPLNFINNRSTDHPQTRTYKNIIQNTILLRAIIQVVKKQGDINSLPTSEAKAAYGFARGNSPIEKLNNCWEEIQNDVNGIVDSDTNPIRERIGLKQIIEKKAGIIRMHMMGKRVNYSARSVITPDPNLNIDEIGIPEAFAKHLTYPVPVTLWNVEELRKMILNGPNVHPGANLVEFEDGTKIRISSNKKNQEALLKRLLTPVDKSDKGFRGVKLVYRHLLNGDILLLNRQPTLHKPSIMAHTARILKGEKTIRLHYANCKAYNADFDGDEMNAHFPQNEIARSEGYNIVNVSNQYLVPKDGTPLSGLIQDHMIAGVRMSIRGRFFSKNDYQQLVYQALAFKMDEIILLPPAIIKPETLWSGKQILSTIIINVIPKKMELINLTATSKIPAKAWISTKPRRWNGGGGPLRSDIDMSEAEVILRGGELLVGILDKTHYGATPYGLIHCIYELYGGTYAIRLLSSLAKVFTRFLQEEGFTLGVKDILCIKQADEERQKIIKESRKIGINTITKVLNLSIDAPLEEIVGKIDEGRFKNPKLRQLIDRGYKSELDSFTNAINKTCLPSGLICKFPENNLQLMVQSGAKGSTVNTMQISCLLGQIELEGKRPPVMISGKSLPSFPKFEFSPRAGGFIDGRFMTGIQPQEFFFHCMAGREGLIDTAVKTSRSGYLQRCLIKHLEGLTVGYDMTVRNADQTVVQFLYGEDGMDISRAQFLNSKQMQFLYDNKKTVLDKDLLKTLKNDEGQEKLKEHYTSLSEWRQKFGNQLPYKRKSPFSVFSSVVRQKTGHIKKLTDKKIRKLWNQSEEDIKESFRKQCVRCPDPLNSIFQPDHYYGALNERLEGLLQEFSTTLNKKARKEAENMLKLKTMQSYCAPGESVGLLAAQSIGEPSTQMTLNTFHFAGRGEMNVTLGIPRLREILMMASKNIKTPSMEVPFRNVDNLEIQSENLRRALTRVCVADVLEKVDVSVKLQLEPQRLYKYVLRFQFLPHKYYKNDFCVNPKYIMKHMQNRFFAEMFTVISKLSKLNSNVVTVEENRRKSKNNGNDDDDDDNIESPSNMPAYDDSSDEEVEDDEDAKATHKFQQAHEDQEPEAEEKEVSDDEEMTVPEADEDFTDIPSKNTVVETFDYAKNYILDEKKQLWCELTFALPLHYNKLDMSAILKTVAEKSVVWQVQNIKKAITYYKNGVLYLRTDGINMNELFKHTELLDINRLYCNDIHKMAETYGIEAAMKIIVKEVQEVFNVYGIRVDPRHLSLIADYMTFNGTFEPLSRKGMESNASPLQQMSFESSLAFLRAATARGKLDDLQNPSSCLMVGKPCNVGTGSFTLLSKIPSFVHT